MALMESVGQQLANWRSDAAFRCVHSEVDFKTEADRRAHELICRGLAQLYPGVDIISEESPVHDITRPHAYWLIDPIDGTASWYHGFNGFVTQAAFIEQGQPFFGIVRAPILGKTWIGMRGDGAYLNDCSLPPLTASQRLIITDNTHKPHGIAQDLSVALHATGYLESGSLGLKSVLVADGSADLFVKDVCVRDWDIAPAAVILDQVGGHLLMSDGLPYVFGGAFEKPDGFIVARDDVLMDRAVRAYAELKKNIDE